MTEAEGKLKPLRAILEITWNSADALKQRQDAEEERSMR
jgi:hypothetical protein